MQHFEELKNLSCLPIFKMINTVTTKAQRVNDHVLYQFKWLHPKKAGISLKA